MADFDPFPVGRIRGLLTFRRKPTESLRIHSNPPSQLQWIRRLGRAHGFHVTIWNRTIPKCQELVALGATVGEHGCWRAEDGGVG